MTDPASESIRRDAYVLVYDHLGRLLLQLRAEHLYKGGQLSPPAGKVEAGETYRQAARRELWEETGIEVAEDQLTAKHTVERWSSDGLWIGIFFVTQTSQTPRITEPEKHLDLSWHSPFELPSMTIDYVSDIVRRIANGETYSAWLD